MVSKKQESTLHFIIGQSLWLKQAIDCLHIVSVLACWLNDLPPLYRLILSLLVLVSWIVHRNACKSDHIFLRYSPIEGWAVSFDGESYLAAKANPTTVTSTMLTVLHLNTDKRSRALVIFKDAMAANDYRRLIVALKISGCSLD